MPVTKGERKWSKKGGSCAGRGGGSCAGRVHEGSTKGSRKGGSLAGRGGFLCKKGLPGGFLVWLVCRKGRGSCAGRGFLGGSWDGFPCRKGGGFLSGMHMPQPAHCVQFEPSNYPPLELRPDDPWQPVRTIYLAHCGVNPSNQWPSDSKGTKCQPASMHTKRPAPVPPCCCERSPRPPSPSSGPRVSAPGGAIFIRCTKMSLLSSVPRANPPKLRSKWKWCRLVLEKIGEHLVAEHKYPTCKQSCGWQPNHNGVHIWPSFCGTAKLCPSPTGPRRS